MLKEIVLAVALNGCAHKEFNGVWVKPEPLSEVVAENGIRVSGGLHYYVYVGKFDFTGDGVEDHVIFFHTPYHNASTLNVLKGGTSLTPIWKEKLDLEIRRPYILKKDDFNEDGVDDFAISRYIERIDEYYTWNGDEVRKEKFNHNNI